MSTLTLPELDLWSPPTNGGAKALDNQGEYAVGEAHHSNGEACHSEQHGYEQFDEDDPFRYGWREKLKKLPNGEEEWICTPPHAQRFPSSPPRRFPRAYRRARTLPHVPVQCAHRSGQRRPHALVMLDTRIGWDLRGIRPHSPDISLIFNVVRNRPTWSTFYVEKEGTRPTLIVEVTSPGTRRLDLIKKLDQYEQVGVAFYVIVDTFQPDPETPRQLIGWELTPEGYVAMPKNERSWIWLKPVGLWLALEDERLACYNRAGEYVEDYIGMMRARRRAEMRSAAEQARADQAELRTNDAERRAAEEARARADLEARLAALQTKLDHPKDE